MKSYASFFEWHDKGRKEFGIVEELVEALKQCSARQLYSPREFTPDPPDCVCEDSAGQAIAIEVAEVVCQDAARLNAQGHAVFRRWGSGELTDHIALVLGKKDGKSIHGGPYQEIIVCLFTDEPMLTVMQAEAELGMQVFGPFNQLSSAYLLFSYDPASQTYPFIKLAFRL